jgi:hypothetical protein
MLYMVVPKGAVDGESIRNSDHFPRLVEAPDDASAEEIMCRIFPDFKPRPGKQYYIIQMKDALLATFRPRRPEYEVTYERVMPHYPV